MPYTIKEARRSRGAYTLECAFEYFVSILIADSFLAKLLSSLGFSDAQTGLISSLISFAFLFQLLSIPVVRKITNVKAFSALFHTASQLLFSLLYLVPFLPMPSNLQRIVAVVCILLAYLGKYLVTSVIYRWGNSYVDPRKRAIYCANKEMISLLSGVAVSLLFGYLMDYFEAGDQLGTGFVVAALGIFVFNACDLVCLMLIKNETTTSQPDDQPPVRHVIRVLFQNKGFCNTVLLSSLWSIGIYMTTSFLGTFKLSELLYTVGQVQLINIAGSMARFALSRPFGRYSDKRSYAQGAELALWIAIASFVCTIFTTASTRWLMVAHSLLNGICFAGLSANLVNMTYSYVDEQYFVQANAIKNSISGVCGFLASMVGSKILALVQANGNQVLGIPMYGQQLLSLITVLILLGAIALVHFVIRKQHIMVQ